MLDEAALAELIAEVVGEEVDKATAPLLKRLAELEAREPVPGPPGEKGEPGERGADGKDGADGRDGQDGRDAANIVEALKDSGELVLTLQDGRLIRTGIRDGEKGADGRDGFSLDDFDVGKADDGRTYIFRFVRGDLSHEYELTFPVPVYCGIFKEGEQYVPGDLVTWGGNAWHCDAPTGDKPDAKGGPWTLMVKRGRDGKDARG